MRAMGHGNRFAAEWYKSISSTKPGKDRYSSRWHSQVGLR